MKAGKLLGIISWTSVALFALLGCEGEKLASSPPELIGIWTADAEGWEGRFLDIRSDSVVFGSGEDNPTPDSLVEVIQEVVDGEPSYIFVCRSLDGNEFRLPVLFEPLSRALRLKNRPRIRWYRETGS